MKKTKNYTDESVINFLRNRKGVRISAGTIEVSKNGHDLGNKSWGRVDFLIKAGYRQIFV